MASLVPSAAASDEKRHRFSFLHRNHKRSSESLSTLAQTETVPPYEKHAGGGDADSDSNSSNGDDIGAQGDNPPAYDELDGTASTARAKSVAPSMSFEGVALHPTLELQLDTQGKSVCSDFARMSRPDPINVYMVNSDDGTAMYNRPPVFISLREKRSSNSCTLVAGGSYDAPGSSSGSSSTDEHRVLSTTVYRVGPGRPPRIALFDPNHASSLSVGDDSTAWDHFEFTGKSIFNRVRVLRSRLGTFEWRYATRDERKALSQEFIDAAAADDGASPNDKDIVKHNTINSLMILERVTQVFGSINNNNNGGGASSSTFVGKPREVRRPVARLIRSNALRTPGTSKHDAGNGGRLQIDLHEWLSVAKEAEFGDVKTAPPHDLDGQTNRDMVVTLAVASCISMLKKELDRRRDAEIAAVV
ncbi:uncharacterized protein SPSK_09341 [Sporothrix schenckii 1099-18]|uniref:Uncharacterized protein n=2 Tax=Sporothrix schenckii TaxID=29908 RepID=U7PYN7_SPOS1|nr:uncharacterized protein SPSK_09341 [Sporothrix schenckii 1099-18]ERT00037.1 hypothetical protein HMPREF1624_03406 [Sporothrix schenckii ATCC 58251]KJR85535.1 hypothetical protein SPSK_09341 [Sporothrix schenckii 1099-18]